jgi:superfamily II DNA/RNA helicase
VQLAGTILHDPASVTVTPVSSTVEIINQFVFFVDKVNKNNLLIELLKDEKIKTALVFTRTKHGADKVVKLLIKSNIKAEAIHGNKAQTARQRALANFKAQTTRVLVATDIAARGIDVEDLEYVINFEVSNIPETYVHRIGRTGRAGAAGTAYSFCDAEEKAYLRDVERLIGKKIPVIDDHPFPFTGIVPESNDPRDKRPLHMRPESRDGEDARPRQQQQRRNEPRQQQAQRPAQQQGGGARPQQEPRQPQPQRQDRMERGPQQPQQQRPERGPQPQRQDRMERGPQQPRPERGQMDTGRVLNEVRPKPEFTPRNTEGRDQQSPRPQQPRPDRPQQQRSDRPQEPRRRDEPVNTQTSNEPTNKRSLMDVLKLLDHDERKAKQEARFKERRNDKWKGKP